MDLFVYWRRRYQPRTRTPCSHFIHVVVLSFISVTYYQHHSATRISRVGVFSSLLPSPTLRSGRLPLHQQNECHPCSSFIGKLGHSGNTSSHLPSSPGSSWFLLACRPDPPPGSSSSSYTSSAIHAPPLSVHWVRVSIHASSSTSQHHSSYHATTFPPLGTMPIYLGSSLTLNLDHFSFPLSGNPPHCSNFTSSIGRPSLLQLEHSLPVTELTSTTSSRLHLPISVCERWLVTSLLKLA